ncbi:hypothetical protein CRYUN_Cryun26dG0086100 [Craigia yunnanensis]
MGKRKRSSQHNNLHLPSSSEDMPCSSGTELLSKEHSSNLDGGMDVGDSSVKLLNSNSSVAQRHYNLGRSMFLKRSRHYYGHHYSRRNSGSLSNPPTSRDGREKTFGRPERIRSSSMVMDAVSPDKAKMICGECQKHLRRKPYFLGNTLASGEFSVVAVLVCGHVYHADCLEERTSLEDRCDPPCPSCSGSSSQV